MILKTGNIQRRYTPAWRPTCLVAYPHKARRQAVRDYTDKTDNHGFFVISENPPNLCDALRLRRELSRMLIERVSVFCSILQKIYFN